MDWKVFDWQSQKVGQKGEVLKRNTYRCGFCKGKGILPTNKAIRCPVCSGSTTVKVPGFAVICAYCNGDGSSYLNRNLTCIVCKGKGVVSIESEDIEVCPTCKGRGREKGGNLSCSICRGKGVIINIIKKKESFSRSSELTEESNALEKTEEMDLTPDETLERIKEKASRIWEEEGRPQGKDFDIWLRAEKEIKGDRQYG